METLRINSPFEKGDKYLTAAHHALNYSSAEQTAQLVCSNGKNALVYFMISFLDHYGEKIYSEDPQVLLNQCRELSANYLDLHISELLRWQNGETELSVNLGHHIVGMAEFARELIVCEMI